MAQCVVNPGACSMCTCEECVFCCFWVECPINIDYVFKIPPLLSWWNWLWEEWKLGQSGGGYCNNLNKMD